MSMDSQEMYAVYYANDLFAMSTLQAEHWYTDRARHYTHVADVVAPLERVFALTNHIDHSWTENPEVVWHTTARVRSTSVGDVIRARQSGQAWLVMPFGFQELVPDRVEHASLAGESERQDMAPPADAGKEGRS